MTDFMMTLRKADGTDGVGPLRYLAIDAGAERELAQADWVNRIIASFPAPPAGPAGVRTRSGDILFLAHGFNVDHAAAVAFHQKCAAALGQAGWGGLVVSYDWPSDGLVFAYLDDRGNARAAASNLVTGGIAILENLQQRGCTISLHVLAHSMGCFVVQQAFVWSYQDVNPGWGVGQVMFAAADVDYTVFSASNYTAKQFEAHSGRLTAYCNRYDKALTASDVKRLDMAPRMGRVGLPADAPPMMCEVDCSDLFASIDPGIGELDPVATHCFYFDQPSFWRDVVLTLAGGIDRSVFPTRDVPPGTPPNRYSLKPGGVTNVALGAALQLASLSPSIRPPS